MREFTAVLFDLDGTLCRNEQDAETVYHGAFEAAGVEPFGEPDRNEQDAETVYHGAFEAAGVEPFGGPDELLAALSGPPAPPRVGSRISRMGSGASPTATAS